jgi:hypothetical protein
VRCSLRAIGTWPIGDPRASPVKEAQRGEQVGLRFLVPINCKARCGDEIGDKFVTTGRRLDNPDSNKQRLRKGRYPTMTRPAAVS